MVYDKLKPETWSTQELLRYCVEHNISVPRGTEARELFEMVNSHLQGSLSCDPEGVSLSVNDEPLEDLLNTPPECILGHITEVSYADILRRNPNKLKEITDAGVQQLARVEDFRRICEAGCKPRVGMWLWCVLMGTDNGAAVAAALEAPPTTAVCGRYFRANEMIAHCNDCAVDPTCVMCMDCFLDSPCRAHNYRLYAGSAGGMCDCGDATAWRTRNFCRKHLGFREGGDAGWAPAAHEPWMEVVLRCIVQLTAVALQQAMALGAAHTPRQSEWVDEEEDFEMDETEYDPPVVTGSVEVDGSENDPAVSRMVSWMFDWLYILFSYLENFSHRDWAKRLLSLIWAEPTPIPSSHLSAAAENGKNASCLEIVFLYQLNAKPSFRRNKVWSVLIRVISNCISDPKFRIPFTALFMTYAERLQCQKSCIDNLYVQVFTCSSTLSALALSPQLLPYTQPSFDSILHRQISSILYSFCQLSKKPKDALLWNFTRGECPPWVIFVNERNRIPKCSCITVLNLMIARCDKLGLIAVLSKTFIRAWLHLLLLCSVNTVIRKDPESITHMHSTTEWINFLLIRTMWGMGTMIRRILSRLQPPRYPLTSADVPQEAAPILSDAMLGLVERSRRFDPTPDRVSHCEPHRRILDQAVVGASESASLLPSLPSSPDEAARIALDYIVSFLREIKAGLDTFLLFQHAHFSQGSKRVVLRRGASSILEYDLLEPVGNMTTLVLPVQRFMAVLIRTWLVHQEALYAHERVTDAVALRVARRLQGCDNREGRKPLRTLIDTLFSSTAQTSSSAQDASLEFFDGLLDSLVMPLVLVSQREEGLWRRNDCNVFERTLKHFELSSNFTLLHDFYLIQVLATCLPPQDFSIRLLQRFSYTRGDPNASQARTDEEGSCNEDDKGIEGLARYLRLMITLIQDASKSNTRTGPIQELHRLAAICLLHDRLAHSKLVSILSSNFFGSLDEDSNFIANNLSHFLDENATAEDGPSGMVFRLKDLQTWTRWVDLYHPQCRDFILPAIVSQYRHIAALEKANTTNSSAWNEEEGDQRDQASNVVPRKAMVPPTQLREDEQHAEFIPSLRALLHTDGLLLPACYVIHLYVFNQKCTADDEFSGENESDSHQVSEHLLLHAITALHLCVQDCAALSCALRAEVGLNESPDATPAEEGGILWEYVEAYLAHSPAAAPPTFAAKLINKYLRLPELAGAPSIRGMLAKPVPLDRLCQAPRLFVQEKGRDGLTTGDVLHELREYLQENPQLDEFSILPMVESILLATGLARFEPSRKDGASGEANGQMKSRQQRIKERQAKLLQRLQNRSSKVCMQMESVREGGGDGEAEASSLPSSLTLTQTPACEGYLHSRLLFELASLECCVCRLTHNEPLMLLGQCSTSAVLRLLRSIELPDGRQVHGHYYACGHAAHKSCTNRIFHRLAQLWQRGNFQGQRFLGASEFLCPICMMVCTNLSPLPVFGSSPGRKDTQDELMLFEDIQTRTVSLDKPEVMSAVEDLCTSLAQAAIGASTSTDAEPIKTYEDPLQKGVNDAWIVSETLRTIYYSFRTTLESVKAGVHEVNQKDLLTFLSLLISIPPQSLEKHDTVLQTNYRRTRRDVFPLLILKVMQIPKRASHQIQEYTESLIAAYPQAKEIARDVLRSLEPMAETPGNEETCQCDPPAQPPGGDPIALWMDLGCLALLKLLVCDEPADAVLDARAENPFFILPLHTSALASASDRAEAILRMWGYLTGVNPGSDPRALAVRFAAAMNASADEVFSVAQAPGRFVNPTQWREFLLEEVLHLPIDYIGLVMRLNCARGEEKNTNSTQKEYSAMCCLCGKFLRIRSRGSISEQFRHIRKCVGSAGIFLTLQHSSLLIIDSVAGRLVEYPPLYTDKFGEADEGLLRGVQLKRNPELCKKFLNVWIRNEWSVNSMLLRRSSHINNIHF